LFIAENAAALYINIIPIIEYYRSVMCALSTRTFLHILLLKNPYCEHKLRTSETLGKSKNSDRLWGKNSQGRKQSDFNSR
jgi:hypothetical protein